MNSSLLLLLALLSPQPQYAQAAGEVEGDPLGEPSSAAVAASALLADHAYAFCHDEDYPLTEEEARWCPLLPPGGSETCPAFVKACESPRGTLVGSGRLSSRTVDEKHKRAGGGPNRQRERLDDDEDAFELPVLGGLAQVLFWVVVSVALVLLVASIVRNLVRSKEPQLPPETAPHDEEGERDEAARAAATRVMETDVERLLALASQRAQAGAFAEAVDFAHAALLRRLDHEGLIRLHASRTNGEYLRELRGNTALLEPVRDTLRHVDRAQFGREAPGRGVFEEIHRRVTAIVKTVGPFVLLLTTLLGSVSACDSDARKSYPWSTSPSGTDAIFALLREEGLEVKYRTDPLTELDINAVPGTSMLVMLSDASATDAEWDVVRDWVVNGGHLLVAGGQLPPWLDISYAYDEPPNTDEARQAMAGEYATLPAGASLVATSGLRDADDWPYPVDAKGNPYIAFYERGTGFVTVLADDSLFTNASLAFEGNADVLVAELSAWGRPIEFVDGFASMGSDTPADTISNTHLTAALVQLLVLILGLYLWRGTRFGRPRDTRAPSRRAFVQHADAMGRQYEKARAAAYAATLFSRWTLERLRNRFCTAASAGLLGLAQEVARRTGREETDVMRLLVAAHSAAEAHPGAGGSGEDLALVRDLGRLMRDIGETP